MTKIIEEKDKVGLTYVGKLDSGDVFKQIDPSTPLYVTIGESELPPTLEIAIKGMKEGEKKSVRVPPDEGYGPRQKDLLQELSVSNFPSSFTLKPGITLSLKVSKDGEEHQVPATVTKIEGETVTVDYNHPLAGHHLTYDIKIISIEKA